MGGAYSLFAFLHTKKVGFILLIVFITKQGGAYSLIAFFVQNSATCFAIVSFKLIRFSYFHAKKGGAYSAIGFIDNEGGACLFIRFFMQIRRSLFSNCFFHAK